MKSGELKPCPFCGDEAGVHETSDGWIVSCSSAQSELDGFTHMSHGYGETEAEAIAAWNTRHERTCRNEWEIGFLCSECGTVVSGLNSVKYCPNCGRKVLEPNSNLLGHEEVGR